ncbi:MAG: RNA ligase family protein [Nanoarchaeota archaeon]
MSSSLIVPVCRIKNNREHPNASLLGICDVLGYQMVVPLKEAPDGPIARYFKKNMVDDKGKKIPTNQDDPEAEVINLDFMYPEDKLVVYFPFDTILSSEWACKFGVQSLLKGANNDRVGKIKLRGEPSFGLVVDIPEGVDWQEGTNVADYYGAIKYEPPVRQICGDAHYADPDIDPFFEKFTDVQNGRIYTDIFEDGEEIIATEKLHGCNGKVALINNNYVAGSMNHRRKRPVRMEGENVIECSFDDKEMKENIYWFPWTVSTVRTMMESIKNMGNIVLYGEIYGGSIQSLTYGIPKGKGLGFRAFGLTVNGKYMDWDDFESTCKKYGVDIVPVIYRGPFSMAIAKQHANGKTTLTKDGQIREGVVCYPVKERTNSRIGRCILKYISDEYLLSKHQDNDTKDI